MKLVRESLVLEKEGPQISSGLAIIQSGSILLGHPKGQKWWGTYSIPKGHVEEGEDLLEAAIRETREEIGITIDPEDVISTEPNLIDYKDEKGRIYKKVYYFLVNPSTPIKQSSINPDKTEIDWAGFILKDAAEARIFWRLKPILDHFDEVTDAESERKEASKKEPEDNTEETGIV